MAGVLSQLQQWSAQSAGLRWRPQNNSTSSLLAQGAGPDGFTAEGDGLLPTVALSLAASTNTAEAYAHLLYTLKQQVCALCACCMLCMLHAELGENSHNKQTRASVCVCVQDCSVLL